MSNSEFTIFTCPNCQKQLRYPKGKHIRFKCPNCDAQYEAIPDEDRQAIVKTVDLQKEDTMENKKTYEINNDPVKNTKEEKTDSNPEKKEEDEGITLWNIVGFLIIFPLFLLLNRILPNPNWVFNLDRILLFAGVLIAVFCIIYFIKEVVPTITSILVLGATIVLTIGSILGEDHYGWRDAYNEYKAILYSCANGPVEVKNTKANKLSRNNIIVEDSLSKGAEVYVSNEYKKKIKTAVDYKDPKVIQFAKKHATEDEHFNGIAEDFHNYRTEIQAFAICKYINTNWKYVKDPHEYDYSAKASETVEHLAGDCDDHAVFMAACIEAIGGEARFILAPKHAYAEMKISKKDLDMINYLIINELFYNEIKNDVGNPDKKLFYHLENDDVWLNLDYTNVYPGAPFLKTDSITMIINL